MRGSGSFTAVDTSPDGSVTAIGDDAGNVVLVDPRTRGRLAKIAAGDGEVADVRFSPDGTRLAIAAGRTVVLLDARSRRELARWVAEVDQDRDAVPDAWATVRTLAFSADSSRLAAAVFGASVGTGPIRLQVTEPSMAREEIVRWDARSGRRLESLPRTLSLRGPGLVDFARAPDTLVVVDARERVTTIRDADTLAVLRRFPVSGAPAAVSPDRRALALGAPDGSIQLVDLSTGVVRRAVGRHRERIRQMRFSADSRMLVTASEDADVTVWDAQRAASVETFSGHAGTVAAATVTADRRTLYSAGLDGALIEWDLTGTRRLSRTFRVDNVNRRPSSGGLDPLLSPAQGRVFAVADDRGTVSIHDSETLTVMRQIRVRRLPGPAITMAIAPDGRTLAFSGVDPGLNLADTRTGRMTQLLGASAVVASAFSPDGRWLAVADTSSHLRLWDRRGSMRDWVAWEPIEDLGLALRFHPSGHSLAVMSQRAEREFELRVYSLPRIQLVKRIAVPGGGSLAGDFAPDGRTFAFGDQLGRTWLYDTATWTADAPPLESHGGPIGSVSFSPDGRLLATTSARGPVRLWDLTSAPPTSTALGTSDNHVAGFIHNGARLLTISDHGRGAMWDLRPQAWVRRACAVAGRSLTRVEWREAMPGRRYAPVCRT
jgi:WD40 repeat protein